MKFIGTYILMFFFFLSDLSAQQKDSIHINGTFRNMTFQEFVTKLEKDYPVHFYFEEKWVSSFIVNLDAVKVIERNRIVFDQKVYIPVGEQYKEAFQSFIDKTFLV